MALFRAAFVAASIAWTLMLPLAPFLATRAHASAVATGIVVVVYSIGHLICHQLPERSFHLWSAQLPVCARCTGIYAGAALVALVALVPAPLKRRSTDQATLTRRATHEARAGRRFSSGASARRSVGHRISGAASVVRSLVVVAALPTAATLVYEWTTGVTPGNLVRAAAGVPIGVIVAWLMVDATRAGATAENQVN